MTDVGGPTGTSETPATDVAFVGFGDLASTWAAALRARAGVRLRAFLPADSPSRGTGLAAQRELRSGVAADTDLAAVIEGAGLVIAAVPASAASAVALACAPHMHSGTVYVDPSSASPEHKQEIASTLDGTGALYADVAVLGTVTISGLEVPLLAAGPGAEPFGALAIALGMNVHVTGPTAGDAARVKLIRSVYMKGRDALLVEMLTTARRCGLDARVVDSIARAPGEQVPFEQLVERVMPALVRHAGRRADELANASAEVERSGLEPTMTTAAERRLRWMASLTQIADLGARPRPPAAGDVVTALADAAAAQAGAAGGDRGAE